MFAAPYCNARATAKNKLISYLLSAVCVGTPKTAIPEKASLVGFHRPDTGTGFLMLLIMIMLMIFGAASVCSKDQEQDHEHEQEKNLISAAEVRPRTPALPDSPGSTNPRALRRFAGLEPNRFPSRPVSW